MKAKLIKIREALNKIIADTVYEGYPSFDMDDAEKALKLVNELLAEMDSEELEDKVTDLIFDMWLDTSTEDYSSRNVARAAIDVVKGEV